MLYTLLCYNDETMTSAWSEAEDAEVMERLDGVHRKWAANMKPVVRLMPTSAATTYRKAEKLITDGPYAETKEQLLGFYVVDVETLEQAHDIVRDLAEANPGGAYEVRPVMIYIPDRSGPENG